MIKTAITTSLLALSGVVSLGLAPMPEKQRVSAAAAAPDATADAKALAAAYNCLKLTEKLAPADEAADYQVLLKIYRPNSKPTTEEILRAQKALETAKATAQRTMLVNDQSQLLILEPSFTARQLMRCFAPTVTI